MAAGEAEAERAVYRVDGDRRRDPQSAEDPEVLLGPRDRAEQMVRDLLGEPPRELLLGRGEHQVDFRDERLAARELLRHAPDQRRLPVAARGKDDDVLPVAGIAEQCGNLGVAVGERVVQRDRPVPERVELHYSN